MALNANKVPNGSSGSRVEQAVLEPGVYPSRTVQIIDMGVQPQRAFQGQEKNPIQEIMLTYELVDSFMIDEKGSELEDKPRWVSETIPLHNLRADKAKSTQRYTALDPANALGGDFSQLTDIPCNVTIVNNESKGKVYANVHSISAMRPRDAAKCPALKNPPKVFDLDAPDLEIFGSLPAWIQDKIKGNLNYKGSRLEKALATGKGVTAADVAERANGTQIIGNVHEPEPEEDDRPW